MLRVPTDYQSLKTPSFAGLGMSTLGLQMFATGLGPLRIADGVREACRQIAGLCFTAFFKLKVWAF